MRWRVASRKWQVAGYGSSRHSPLATRQSRAQRGFTLIELVTTVAIVAILATLALPMAELEAQRQRERELLTALRQIRGALDAYRTAVEEGRIPAQVDGSGYPPSLEALVQGVADARSPEHRPIYFLRRLPRDPFYPDPAADAAETWGKRSYASAPEAPEEGEDVFDVYSRSERIGINGVAYREW